MDECKPLTLGAAVGISPAILGVTVLAWGNSVGDLVADVVIARGGQPTMAVASCYAVGRCRLTVSTTRVESAYGFSA